ncbi:M48 family metalloprotease [Pseudovibrio brasiliensis]|uniref:M48 family metalloprotease n=1 Tax=Pseudovibrio brasiliensis TaxID=1898042 RepID=A0ABX8AYT2_9HYPH|nr:M48 family metalloprotease [Pseudovibrio brasiliensis]QUS58990.1 M48 family metalloprotease [Pseudovibrio brasiliensis]QUS59125.1 M48 family metalloprotease [Pseudovibrio brasiliensis]
MRNLFRHIAIDLNWFISWSIIAIAAHVALFWVAMPITWSINTFADLPFQIPEESSLLIVCIQVFLFWLILRVPGLVEFFYDIELGARRPSEYELHQIEAAYAYLQGIADAKGIKLPRIVWRVIDKPNYNACAFGRNRVALNQGALYDTKFRDRGLEELAALIAHEIGHLRHWDTVHIAIRTALVWPFLFALKLNNLVYRIPFVGLFFNFVIIPCNFIITIAARLTGLTSRMGEYRADEFSQKLLGKDRMLQVFAGLSEDRDGTNILAHYLNSHPPTELRRENLRKRTDYRPQFNIPPTSDLIELFRKQ